MTGHVLDLTNYHFVRELGDIRLYGTWVGETFDESEPALVLVPAFRIGGMVPCCIALSSAYKYNEPAYLLHAAQGINQHLGRPDDMSNVHKVADIIHSHLQDLIEMPPRPIRGSTVGADATVTDASGKTIEAEIHDYH